MLLDAFLDRLRQTPRAWSIRGTQLRYGPWALGCPVSVVAGQPERLNWFSMFEAAGLDKDTARSVAQAADMWPDYDPVLRARLLEACDCG